jgi:hypothetical protein
MISSPVFLYLVSMAGNKAIIAALYSDSDPDDQSGYMDDDDNGYDSSYLYSDLRGIG